MSAAAEKKKIYLEKRKIFEETELQEFKRGDVLGGLMETAMRVLEDGEMHTSSEEEESSEEESDEDEDKEERARVREERLRENEREDSELALSRSTPFSQESSESPG